MVTAKYKQAHEGIRVEWSVQHHNTGEPGMGFSDRA